jgi:hypothetical protein
MAVGLAKRPRPCRAPDVGATGAERLHRLSPGEIGVFALPDPAYFAGIRQIKPKKFPRWESPCHTGKETKICHAASGPHP